MEPTTRIVRALVGFAAVIAVTTAALGTSVPAAGAAAVAGGRERSVRRILVLSLPTVSWADLAAAHLPNLDRLFREAAVGDLSTRSVHSRTRPGDGYATLGAGTRTLGDPAVDGLAFGPAERFGAGTAGQAYTRRTGDAAHAAIVSLATPALEAENRALLFDTRVGALGDAFEAHGWRTAVVANADTPGPTPTDGVLRREAALGLADRRGRVDAGRVDPGLLTSDPTAPFGVRTDAAATVQAFQAAWTDRSVVLVEASDLGRLDAAHATSTAARRRTLLVETLRRTDALAGALLQAVDPSRDAVLVVGPYHPSNRIQLTVAALRSPGVRPGLLQSSTTRRAGFVQIVDVAPTLLDLAGIPRPDAMEGRPVDALPRASTLASRLGFLAGADRAARFRDATLGTAGIAFVVASLVLAFVTAIAIVLRARRTRFVLRLAALALIGFVAATYLAHLVPLDRHGAAAYWSFVLTLAIAFAAACTLAGRGRPLLPLGIALGALVVLHVGDALSGAHLELNTVFGYTPTVGIRLAGLGNLAYSQLTAASLLLAGLLAWRIGGRRGAAVAAVLLAVVLVVVAAPFWGQNFGGSLAAAPVFVLAVLLLTGRRLSVRAVTTLAAVGVATGLAIGFVDLARPAAERTHVGRFFEQVANDGWHGFALVIHRKADESLGTFAHSVWTPMTVGVLVFLAFLAWNATLRRIEHRVPTLRHALVAILVLLVLGVALKDSGIAVPGMMLGVVNVALVYLASRLVLAPADPAASDPAPADATPGEARGG